MSLGFNSGKKVMPNIGNGMYPARVVQILDFGVQRVEDIDGNIKILPRVWVTFEFPTKRIEVEEDGKKVDKPRWLGKEYTHSDNEKSNMYKLVTNLKPDFNFEVNTLVDILGLPGMVQVGTTSGEKDKVVSVSPPVEGMEIPELYNPTVSFDMSDPNMDVFLGLPVWMKRKVLESEDYPGSVLQHMLDEVGFTLE